MKKLIVAALIAGLLSGCSVRAAGEKLDSEHIDKTAKSFLTKEDVGNYSCGTDVSFQVEHHFYKIFFVVPVADHGYTVSSSVLYGSVGSVQVWAQSALGKYPFLYLVKNGKELKAAENGTGVIPSSSEFKTCQKTGKVQ